MSFSFKFKSLLIGKHGEKIATEYLKGHGYKILETNFSNPDGRRLGEIDIIAKDREEMVFIEVKTRSDFNKNSPLPEESINAKKLHKINKIANFYINKHSLFDVSCRFDAISILLDNNKNCSELRHLKNIFL
ncbi:MAG TPA: YraN family protein [Candidatus Moranbacteria bacterium]|nr:YraN family protein [Candidatus Moranbacteria bacterium]HRZ33589.1 YraN family protein [Candidatus Moranbacteria bacterium]